MARGCAQLARPRNGKPLLLLFSAAAFGVAAGELAVTGWHKGSPLGAVLRWRPTVQIPIPAFELDPVEPPPKETENSKASFNNDKGQNGVHEPPFSRDEDNSTRNGGQAGDVPEIIPWAPRAEAEPEAGQAAAPRPVQGTAGEPPRRLQDSCMFGTDFTLEPSFFVPVGGCYSPDAVDSNVFVTEDFQGMMLPATYLSDDLPDIWWLGKVLAIFSDGALLLELACESSTSRGIEGHPSDSTSWKCLVDDIGYEVPSTLFGLTCGCAAVSSTSDVPSPVPDLSSVSSASPVPGSSPVAGSWGCQGADPFSILSSVEDLQEFEGCYEDVADSVEVIFTQTGELANGDLAVFASEMNGQDRWILGTFSTDLMDMAFTCISDESPAEYHPVNSTFNCDLTSTGAYIPMSDDQLSVSCGCNEGSSTSSTDDGSGSTSSSPRAQSTASPSPTVDSATPSTADDDATPFPTVDSATPSTTDDTTTASPDAEVEAGASGDTSAASARHGALSATVPAVAMVAVWGLLLELARSVWMAPSW